ncbi:glycosyltransferase [Streptomyces sp. 110]|uniref:Glycosyltransferase n=1 Tax=Streptomyces endocoffeicus TaxID=2898945 RepID=A0ABS1PST5_9ACTN|nr:glycosyltransferase [Streptomyces endocoffeicus]MBL1114761.1 glycosyltransferase [Streptomyces endocoffeicus]
MIVSIIYLVLIVVSVLLTVQSAHVLYLMLYTWDRADAERRARAPEEFLPPQISFSVLLPARHEEDVIQSTIERVVRANYPAELLEVFVICSQDDDGTIKKAEEKIDDLKRKGLRNVRVVVFDDKPINKPHGLNTALPHTANQVVTIFDAEDDIHPEIFNLVNTVMVQEKVRVVQAGVQLMNYESNWYSTLNVLEYFFWFKSRLHYHAHFGSIPLGGNTVFFARELLLRLGGWDDRNLTEDADMGLRISAMGERVRVVYDDRYVTKEETPPTLGHFIRQRTRWSQGFMQTLKKGTWKKMPTRKQRWLAFYVLVFPRGQALLGIYLPISLGMILILKVPVLIALCSYLPVLLLAAHFLVQAVGLYEFTGAHGLEASPKAIARMAIAWFPFQMVLAYAALRAMRREMLGRHDWEKTQHVGAHRATTEEAESRVG